MVDRPKPARPHPASRVRSAIRKNPKLDRAYRAGVGVAGAGVVGLGVVLIPLPGPGALIAIGGLAILGTEFEGAKKAQVKATDAARKAAAFAKQQQAARKARKASDPSH